MRITSGILRGRRFNVPKKGMRPTKEQVREAVFSSLADWVPEARVLDLFAGAGGYSLEAWSRGAAEVTAVEKEAAHWKNLQANMQALEGPELGDFRAVQADAYEFLKRGGCPYDLIFADPPYDLADLPRLLEAVGDALDPEGVLVFEMRASDAYSLLPEWNLIKEKVYGETRLLFLERAE